MLAYKLFINGLKANFSGYNKGLITINDISYEWDNNEGPTPPVGELIFNALPYEVGTIDAPVRYNDYITIEGASGTFNINAKDPAYSYQGMDYDKVFRMASGSSLVTVVINRGQYRYLDVIAAATSNRTIYINGYPTGTVPRNEGAVNAIDNFDMTQEGLGDVINITVSGGTDLVEIRLRPEDGPEPEPVEPMIVDFLQWPYEGTSQFPADSTTTIVEDFMTMYNARNTYINIISGEPKVIDDKAYDRYYRLASGSGDESILTIQPNEYNKIRFLCRSNGTGRALFIDGEQVWTGDSTEIIWWEYELTPNTEHTVGFRKNFELYEIQLIKE